MDNKNYLIRNLFYLSVILLFVTYLFPGSIIGYFLYGNLSKQPNLISNPAGTSINHFIYFFYLSIVGSYAFLKSQHFKNILIFLLFSSIILEILHLIVPKRSFQYLDLFANLGGVLIGYCIIIITKKWKKMSKFDEREKSFEKKFVHDEEIQFKINAKRNKYLGEWAASRLGKDKSSYILEVIKSDFSEPGDEDVFKKIQDDFKNANINISDLELREQMRKTLERAKKDFI